MSAARAAAACRNRPGVRDQRVDRRPRRPRAARSARDPRRMEAPGRRPQRQNASSASAPPPLRRELRVARRGAARRRHAEGTQVAPVDQARGVDLHRRRIMSSAAPRRIDRSDDRVASRPSPSTSTRRDRFMRAHGIASINSSGAAGSRSRSVLGHGDQGASASVEQRPAARARRLGNTMVQVVHQGHVDLTRDCVNHHTLGSHSDRVALVEYGQRPC